MPKDRITQKHQGYAFVEYASDLEAEYASKIANGVKLFGKSLRVNRATQDRKLEDVGATIFIGNLSPEVDERMLQETFGVFGTFASFPNVMRDAETGASKGYAFISYDNFESSDSAIDAMNGQFMMNKPIKVTYALKKDGSGARHGDETERLLAAKAKANAAIVDSPVFPQFTYQKMS